MNLRIFLNAAVSTCPYCAIIFCPIYIEGNNTILDFYTNLNYDLRACTVDNQEMNDQGRQVWGS